MLGELADLLAFFRVVEANYHIAFGGAEVIAPKHNTDDYDQFMIRRSTLELLLQKLLLRSCPNIRIIDGTVRQVSIRKESGDNAIQSLQVRHTSQSIMNVDNPALVIGK
jgi:hypothetical protein